MTTLMVYAGSAPADAAVTRTGGVPLAPRDFVWPRCRTCDGNMQFLAEVLLDDLEAVGSGHVEASGILLLFMCNNDPGMCDDWDPTSGGNRALIVAANGLEAMSPPSGGETALGGVSSVYYVHVDGNDYDEARDRWTTDQDQPTLDVIGQLGGTPAWLQNDETPPCPTCSVPMSLVVQLEEGHDPRTSANFGGGGCAYAFACEMCREAAFLWQC